MIATFIGALGIGLLGSFHCMGMCGPLVLAYSLHMEKHGNGDRPLTRSVLHHLSFHSGRLLTYGFLGALAGGVFYGVEVAPYLDGVRAAVTLAAGLLMMLFGLVLLGVIAAPLRMTSLPAGMYGKLGRLVTSSSPLSKLLLGLGTGFLPCMLPWAMLVKAASTSNPVEGFAIMILFGLGTVPALLFSGISATLLSVRVRLAGERLAGFSVMVMGGILLWKGVRYFL